MTLLKNPILFLSLAILCATATAVPTSVGDPLSLADFVSKSDPEVEALTGPVRSQWLDPSRLGDEWKDSQERAWQQERVAFRQFSERVVSTHCSSLLGSTLNLLDNVRDFVHDRLEVKESFDFLEPVLVPLTTSLSMKEELHLTVYLTEKEVEEERKRAEEEQDEEKSTLSPSLSPKEKKSRDMVSNSYTLSWTEESEPQLLFRYRLRRLEKVMALLPYVLRFAPDPVRQALEENGFVQQTKALREEVRSLLTCEGVSHVSMTQLKEKWGRFESDSYMDRDAASLSVTNFSGYYYTRLIRKVATSRRVSTPHAWGKSYGLRNTTSASDHEPCQKVSEDREQLKDQAVEDQLLFKTPQVQFVWTWEAIVRLWNATESDREDRMNPEVIALMFQD